MSQIKFSDHFKSLKSEINTLKGGLKTFFANNSRDLKNSQECVVRISRQCDGKIQDPATGSKSRCSNIFGTQKPLFFP